MQPAADPTRRRQLGRYELIARIGEGGMAEVQLARLRGAMGFEKLVVLKLVHEHLASQKSFVEMLMQEARLAALVKHPNVVDIYDLGESDGRYFVAMEYLAGEPMLAVLRAGRDGQRLDPLSTARLIAEVAEGLTAAHQLRSMTGEALPLVHHDISLGNIMVLYTGQAKLVDFGVAKAGDKAQADRKDRIKGKFGYMAPEKLRGEGGDPRSDLFSLGVVLWEALTLRRLFRADRDLEAIQQVLEEPILAPSRVNGDVPRAFDRICDKALQRNVEHRYQTAAELATDLEAVLKDAAYSGKYEAIAQYMQQTFAGHIRARSELIKEASTAAGPSDQVVSAAFEHDEASFDRAASPARPDALRAASPARIDPAALADAATEATLPVLAEPVATSELGGQEAASAELAPTAANPPVPAESMVPLPPVLPTSPRSLATAWPEHEASVTQMSPAEWPMHEHSVTEVAAIWTSPARPAPLAPPLFSLARPAGWDPKSSATPTIPALERPAVRAAVDGSLKKLDSDDDGEATEVTESPVVGAGAPPPAKRLTPAIAARPAQATTPSPPGKIEATARPAAAFSKPVPTKPSTASPTPAPDRPIDRPIDKPIDRPIDQPVTTSSSPAPDAGAGVGGETALPAAAALSAAGAPPSGPAEPGARDVLGGWGWSTNSVNAIPDEVVASTLERRRRTLWIGAVAGGLVLLVVVALAASGGKSPPALAPPQLAAGSTDSASATAGSATFPGAARADHIALAPEVIEGASTAAPTPVAPALPEPTAPSTAAPVAAVPVDAFPVDAVPVATTDSNDPAGSAPASPPRSTQVAATKNGARDPAANRSPPPAAAPPSPTPAVTSGVEPRDPPRAHDSSDRGKKHDDLDVESTFKAGQAEFLRGDARAALSTFRKVLAASSGFAPAWRGSALALERLGQKAAAARALRRYLKLAPNAGDAAQIRARLERLE